MVAVNQFGLGNHWVYPAGNIIKNNNNNKKQTFTQHKQKNKTSKATWNKHCFLTIQKSVFTLTRGSQGQNLKAGPKFAIKELWNLGHRFSTLLSLLDNKNVRLNKFLDF